jgi:DNA-binding beta-propeller fold protein YncE
MKNRLSRILTIPLLAASLTMAVSAQSIITTIPIANGAIGVTVNPITNTIYAVTPAGTAATANLAVIDGSTNTLTTEVAVPVGSLFVAVDDFTNHVFVAGCDRQITPIPCTVTTIDGNTNTVINTLQLTTTPGPGVEGIVVNSLTGRVYVADTANSAIDIVNGYQNTLVGSISLNGNTPVSVAINPLLDLLYVPYGTNQTAVISAVTNQILSTTTFGAATVGAAANYLNGEVYVTDEQNSQTGVFNPLGDVLTSIQVGDQPLGVDVDPFSNLIFVVSTLEDNVEVINGSTNTVTGTVPGIRGLYVAVNVATQNVYVTGAAGVTVLSE